MWFDTPQGRRAARSLRRGRAAAAGLGAGVLGRLLLQGAAAARRARLRPQPQARER